MDKLIWTVKLCGNIAICYPYSSRVFHLKGVKIPLNIVKIIHLLFLVAPFATYLRILFQKTATEQTGSPDRSTHISFYLGCATNMMMEFFIRFGSIFYASDVLQLVDALNTQLRSSSVSVRGTQRKQVSVWYIYGAMALAISIFAGTVEVILKYATLFQAMVSFAPTDSAMIIVSTLVTAFLSFLTGAALLYACIFVVIFGIALLNAHENCVCRLEEFVRSIGSKLDGRGSSCLMLGRSQELGDIVEEFRFVRKIFRAYEKIAGCYVLAIISNSILNAIRGLSFERHNLNPVTLYAAGTTISNGISVPGLLFFCNFGYYMESSIRSHQRAIRSLRVEAIRCHYVQVTQAIKWMEKWSWNLDARGLFVVNHRLILTSVATILTYFILLVQLQTSEKFGNGHANDSSINVVDFDSY